MNKINFCKFLLFIIICFAGIQQASAQVNYQNLSNINVDNLSDQQIRQLMQQAQSSGMSDAELIQQAQGRGMSATQIQKLQARVNALRLSSGTGSKVGDTTASTKRVLNYDIDSLETSPDKYNPFEDMGPKIFGQNIFKNKNMKFEPNLKLATPVNYIVGPEDQLNISVYGNSQVNWKLEVSPEGNINIPGIGVMNVGGKTIEQVTATIRARLIANRYAIGNGSSLQVNLGNIRSIKVIMVGQLVKPGTYTLPSLATVFNALYAAGGPNNIGSLRQIEIIRNNRVIRHLDVYDFLVKGIQKDNISLQDQDIIRVPTYRTRVELSGQIKIPALFEVLPGENLQNVLDFSGGFTDSAYTARIKVSQISDQQRRITDVFEADYKNYIPLRGDKYIIESIINRFENRVVINVAVFRPGEYELQK